MIKCPDAQHYLKANVKYLIGLLAMKIADRASALGPVICGRKPPVRVRKLKSACTDIYSDVGQGDAALQAYTGRCGRTQFSDKGHNGEILPLSQSEGVSRIDLLVLATERGPPIGGLSRRGRKHFLIDLVRSRLRWPNWVGCSRCFLPS